MSFLMSSHFFEAIESFSSDFQNALWKLFVGFNARLHLENSALINHQLSVFGDVHLEPVHRPRSGSFEIQTAPIVTAAVARAFELILGGEPTRCASKVRAFREDRVDAFLLANNPDALFLLVFLA